MDRIRATILLGLGARVRAFCGVRSDVDGQSRCREDAEDLRLEHQLVCAQGVDEGTTRGDWPRRASPARSRPPYDGRSWLASLGGGALAFAAFAGLGTTSSASADGEYIGVEEQPNILLLIGDDLSWDHYGFSGHPVIQTPALDALAAESIRYTHAYTPSYCRPSLATLLTGLPQHEHGVTFTEGPSLADFDTIAHRLDSAGYSSYQAGKFWEGLPTLRGFTAFSPWTSFVGDLEIGRVGVDQVLDWAATERGPWFVWFSPLMPHSPHNPPGRYVQLYEGLGLSDAEVLYYAMISWFDDVVGELIAGLPAETVVIYLADNGYVQGEIPESSDGRSKATSYEHGIRTELLIRHPQSDGSLRSDPVHAVDVPSTILALAGADTSGLPGRDLLREDPRHDHVTGSNWVAFESPGELIDRWVVTDDRWKLVDDEAGTSRLHDLETDPDELENLADEPLFAEVRQELQLLIDIAFVPEPTMTTLNLVALATLTMLRRWRSPHQPPLHRPCRAF